MSIYGNIVTLEINQFTKGIDFVDLMLFTSKYLFFKKCNLRFSSKTRQSGMDARLEEISLLLKTTNVPMLHKPWKIMVYY